MSVAICAEGLIEAGFEGLEAGIEGWVEFLHHELGEEAGGVLGGGGLSAESCGCDIGEPVALRVEGGEEGSAKGEVAAGTEEGPGEAPGEEAAGDNFGLPYLVWVWMRWTKGGEIFDLRGGVDPFEDDFSGGLSGVCAALGGEIVEPGEVVTGGGAGGAVGIETVGFEKVYGVVGVAGKQRGKEGCEVAGVLGFVELAAGAVDGELPSQSFAAQFWGG